jgi:hypothetical protein
MLGINNNTELSSHKAFKFDLTKNNKIIHNSFFNLWVAHILVVLSVGGMTLMKRYGNYTAAQVCQIVVVTAYLLSILLAIYTVKRFD